MESKFLPARGNQDMKTQYRAEVKPDALITLILGGGERSGPCSNRFTRGAYPSLSAPGRSGHGGHEGNSCHCHCQVSNPSHLSRNLPLYYLKHLYKLLPWCLKLLVLTMWPRATLLLGSSECFFQTISRIT